MQEKGLGRELPKLEGSNLVARTIIPGGPALYPYDTPHVPPNTLGRPPSLMLVPTHTALASLNYANALGPHVYLYWPRLWTLTCHSCVAEWDAGVLLYGRCLRHN